MILSDDPNMAMSLARFGALVAAYGSDPGRWPMEERVAAQAFLAASQEARDLVEREAALDHALGRLAAPHIGKSLEDAIMARRPLPQPAPMRRFALRGAASIEAAWHPAGVFCTAAVLGIILGLNIVEPLGTALSQNQTNTDEILAYALPAFGEGESGQ